MNVRRSRAFDHLFDAVLVVDRHSRLTDYNTAAQRLFGLERDSALGLPLGKFLNGEATGMDQIEASLRADGRWQGQSRVRDESGNGANLEVRMSPLFDDLGNMDGAVCVCRDISLRLRQEDELARLAHTDQLTGLPNRLLFLDRLKLSLATARRTGQGCALLFMDLDGFKAINDEHGHGTGDRVLKAVAQRLGRLLRENDTLARWGGDEFVALLSGVNDKESAAKVAEKLLETMTWPVSAAGEQYHLGISIGVALGPRHGNTPDDLLHAADKAMYEAKQTGRQRYHLARDDRTESAA